MGVASTLVNKKKNTDISIIPTADRVNPALLLVSPTMNKNAMNKIKRNTAEVTRMENSNRKKQVHVEIN